MRLLIDAHALIWVLDDPRRLPPASRAALEDAGNELFVGAGTIWELSIKVALGRLALSLPFADWMSQAIRDLGASVVPIRIEHATAQIGLPYHHRDPFDRLLIAQALHDGFGVVSADAVFDRYGVPRLW